VKDRQECKLLEGIQWLSFLKNFAQVTDLSLVLLHRKAGRIPGQKAPQKTTKEGKPLHLSQETHCLKRIFIMPGTLSTSLWTYQNKIEM